MSPLASPVASRRTFLRPHTARARVVRPPQARAEETFITLCTRCNACIESCPPQIIVRGDGGFPFLDFRRGECTLCAACIQRCTTGALHPLAEGTALRQIAHMEISPSCLAQQQIECRICETQCPQDAIRFRPRLGGIAQPERLEASCTGCGACYAPCPSRAITLEPLA